MHKARDKLNLNILLDFGRRINDTSGFPPPDRSGPLVAAPGRRSNKVISGDMDMDT